MLLCGLFLTNKFTRLLLLITLSSLVPVQALPKDVFCAGVLLQAMVEGKFQV